MYIILIPYVRFKIKTNIEKLIGFYWKYTENNISQYSDKILQYIFSCIVTPLIYMHHSYMWGTQDVQVDWKRSFTYGRAPTPMTIDIQYSRTL